MFESFQLRFWADWLEVEQFRVHLVNPLWVEFTDGFWKAEVEGRGRSVRINDICWVCKQRTQGCPQGPAVLLCHWRSPSATKLCLLGLLPVGVGPLNLNRGPRPGPGDPVSGWRPNGRGPAPCSQGKLDGMHIGLIRLLKTHKAPAGGMQCTAATHAQQLSDSTAGPR